MSAIFILPLIGSVIVTVLGAIWYSAIFGKAYRNAMGVDPSQDLAAAKKSMVVGMLVEFVTNYITLFGLLALMNIAFAGTYKASLIFASLVWFFFMMPQKASQALWSGRPKKAAWTLFGINASYALVSFAIVGPLFIWLVGLFA